MGIGTAEVWSSNSCVITYLSYPGATKFVVLMLLNELALTVTLSYFVEEGEEVCSREL